MLPIISHKNVFVNFTTNVNANYFKVNLTPISFFLMKLIMQCILHLKIYFMKVASGNCIITESEIYKYCNILNAWHNPLNTKDSMCFTYFISWDFTLRYYHWISITHGNSYFKWRLKWIYTVSCQWSSFLCVAVMPHYDNNWVASFERKHSLFR